MTFGEFITIVEVVLTTLAVVGIALALYLLSAERQDRALTIADNGRTGILSWALVLNESLRVAGQLILLVVGIASLATPNQTAPASLVGPLMPVTLMLFAAISVAQSAVLIYARARIARYVPPPKVEAARQDTLIEVQHDVERVYEKTHDVDEKIADLTKRATTSEKRADISERRADAAEERES